MPRYAPAKASPSSGRGEPPGSWNARNDSLRRRSSMPDSDLVSGVVAEVLRSPRHRWLASDVVTRVAATESPKARTQADAVKRTKRRLHQAFGAYLGDLRPEAALDQLTAAWRSADPGAFEQVCRRLLAQHASTRERLPVLETFYREIFAHTG